MIGTIATERANDTATLSMLSIVALLKKRKDAANPGRKSVKMSAIIIKNISIVIISFVSRFYER